MQVSFGVGPFPFGLFSTTFNVGGGGGANGDGEEQLTDAETVSKFFLAIAIFFILWMFVS